MDLDEKATVRFETMSGKQGQMDWGFFEDHLVYEDGKWKKLYCFLMILGYSRMRYIEFVTDMSTNTLIRCHQNAFRYFGGYPEEMLYWPPRCKSLQGISTFSQMPKICVEAFPHCGKVPRNPSHSLTHFSTLIGCA